jgi:hypothetical protein
MNEAIERQAKKPEIAPLLGILSAQQVRSRKSLQKLVYFLQEGEEMPLGLEFRMYHYGPYAAQLDSRLTLLEALGIVDVSRDDNDVPTYDLSAEAGDAFSHLEGQAAIDQVVKTFGNKNPIELELLSTVHFLATHNPPADDEQLFSRLQAWKGPKFRHRQMESALQELRDLGYLP